MATYTYKCKAKRPHIEEVDQKMSELPLTMCPHKGCGLPTKRIIAGATAVVYQGNDWTRKADREF